MSKYYSMRRANGDLFIQEIRGKICIPVWATDEQAVRFKVRNPELTLYRPSILERRMVELMREKSPDRDIGLFLFREDSSETSLDSGVFKKDDDFFDQVKVAPSSVKAQV